MNDQQRAAMQMALEALIANLRGTSGRFPLTNEAITALREALAEQAKQEPVEKIALKNCIYFDSIDFNQTPPYLQYDTGDSTPKENWTIYCDIQEDLRKNGYELTDSDVDHDTVCGDVTPIDAIAHKADCEVWSYNAMAYRPGGLSMDQEQESNSIFMEGYRIGLAEMREKCAKVCESKVNVAEDWDSSYWDSACETCAAAIRDINFEGDTGFRPVSEMIAEHKQDPKKKAAIERAELRKQVAALKAVVDAWNNVEQEPVGYRYWDEYNKCYFFCDFPEPTDGSTYEPLYAAPVRTKDLTDDEIEALWMDADGIALCRAVIAADREKNRGR